MRKNFLNKKGRGFPTKWPSKSPNQYYFFLIKSPFKTSSLLFLAELKLPFVFLTYGFQTPEENKQKMTH